MAWTYAHLLLEGSGVNIAQFKQSPSGQVVKIGQGEAGYHSFVPNPLPPELSYDRELVLTLSDADRAISELSGVGRIMPNPNLLIRPFIVREAVLSSRIEGTQSSVSDVYAYEAGQLYIPGMEPGPAEDDVREVLNYVHALEYGINLLDQLPVSKRMFTELHFRLMQGVRGDKATPGYFRTTQNWIGRPGSTLNGATYVPPPVKFDHMMNCLDALEKYINAPHENPPLIRLALIHYQFEAIHPFIDGNGRIGRLLMSMLMIQWNLLPAPLLYLSAFFERNRSTYYDLLLEVSQQGNWRDWVLFFLQGVAEQARDAGDRAKKLQDLQAGWRQQLAAAKSPQPMLLADKLFDTPLITATQAARMLNVTYPTASDAIKRLVEAGVLHQVGDNSRERAYAALDIIRIVSVPTSHDSNASEDQTQSELEPLKPALTRHQPIKGWRRKL